MNVKHLLSQEGVEVREKGDWKWQHLPIPVFFFFVGLFRPRLKKLFYDNYWTAIGSTIYAPVGRYKSFLMYPQAYEGVIRHEVQHIIDSRKKPVLYHVLYVVSRKWRAYYELRGYTQTLMTQHEQQGVIYQDSINRVIRYFTDSYVYDPISGAMDPEAAPKILSIVSDIESGSLRGLQR